MLQVRMRHPVTTPDPTRKRPLIPAYSYALFDEVAAGGDAGGEGPDAGAADANANASGGDAAAGASGGAASARAQARDDRGRFSIPATEDPRELKRALEEAKRVIDSAHDRIGELNVENQKHRRNYNTTKAELDSVKSQVKDFPALQQQVAAQQQRLLRSETREALRAAGAVSDRVVDLFLADHKDKVAIDPQTGEPSGIVENLEAWKTANAAFFKPPAAAAAETDASGGASGGSGSASPASTGAGGAAGAGATTGGGSGDGTQRANATAAGASLAGGGGGSTGTVDGLPDLRKLSPAERKAAIADYKRSLRQQQGRRAS